MTKTIIAIGGGEIGRIKVWSDGHREQKPIETAAADNKIMELAGREHPTLVFIGAASGDAPAYFDAIQNHFGGRLGAKVINLKLADAATRPNAEEIRNTIMGANIVYIGGGNVTRLMNILRETGVDRILSDAYNNGVVMSGNSAGGCVWFEHYDNDEDADFDGTFDTLKTKNALGWVRGFFVPHWNKKPETGIDKDVVSKEAINRMLTRESKFGYAVDEGAALMIQTDGANQTLTEIISTPNSHVYKLPLRADKVRNN